MEVENLDPIERLSERECWDLLDGSLPARLAFTVGDYLDITPINYVPDGQTVLFRTAPGNKLLAVSTNPRVAFETDGRVGDTVYSVVIRGNAHVVEDRDEIERAEKLGLAPLAPTLKYNWVRITPAEISGVRFTTGPEPERY